MKVTPVSNSTQDHRRFLVTLGALILPMLVAALFSGTFLRAGVLRPGEIVYASGGHNMSHMAPARESETRTTTPGSTGTAGTTQTPGSTGTAGTTTTPGSTGTAGTTQTPASTGTAQATVTPGGTIVDVQMQRHDVFVPSYVTIQTGTTVRWTNMDDEQHTTTSDDGTWNSGALNPGQQFLYTFNIPGTYHYRCLIHPAEMQADIVVTGTAITPTPGPSQTVQPTSTPGTGTVDVSILNYAFQPQNVSINVGSTIRWTNLDSAPHTATSDTGAFDSGTLSQGGTYSFTFNSPGTYQYHCNVHPSMHGTITVGNTGSTGTPTAQTTQTTQPTGTAVRTATPATTNTAMPSTTAQSTGTAMPSATVQSTGTAMPSATTVPQIVNVSIRNYAYLPQTVTVQAGTTVRWTNLDNDMHSVTSQENPPIFNSGEFGLNGTWSYTFTTAGSYSYFCTVHGTFMTGTIVVQAAATATPSPVPGQIFSDVRPTDYFYTAVNWLASRNIISGYADGTFRPYNNTTRGQLSKIVVLGEGWSLVTGTQHFSDVPASNPFYAYVETAYSHGVISGYADGTFRPGNNVTRAQLSKIVVSARGWSINTTGGPHFSDVPASDPFYAYIETAFNHTVISGYADGTFRPGNNATRGQISKIVYNALTGAR